MKYNLLKDATCDIYQSSKYKMDNCPNPREAVSNPIIMSYVMEIKSNDKNRLTFLFKVIFVIVVDSL